MSRPALRGWLLCCISLLAANAVLSAEPVITGLTPRGLQTGHTTRLLVQGTGLGSAPQLLAPFDIAEQKIVQATDSQVELELSLAADIAGGVYAIRIYNQDGVSAPVLIAVDALPQTTAAQLQNETLPSLPLAVTGELTGSTILQWTFSGQRGQRIACDMVARRLGSALQPVVRILDAGQTQLAFSGGHRHLSGDARCEVVLPADGSYRIQLQDRLFRGAAPGFFRLSVGDVSFDDTAYPLGVQRGVAASIALAASPSGSIQIAPAPDQPGGWLAASAPALTGSAPYLMLSDHAELVEERQDDQPQSLPAAPVAVSGRLDGHRQKDVYQLPVQPGHKLRLEVFAGRLGSPVDGVLVLRDASGNQLARGDDQRDTTDPRVEYTPPEGIESLTVEVSDLTGQGSPHNVYRLAIEQAGLPDFSVSVSPDRLAVASQGVQIWQVKATRDGYAGPIKLDVLGAPAGLHISSTDIAPETIYGLIAVQAEDGPPAAGLVRIVASGADSQPPLTRFAEAAESALPANQPWMREQFALARVQAAPLALAWGSLGESDQLYKGAKWSPPVVVQRTEGTTGAVRLRLLTTQLVPKKKVKEKDKEVVVDDLDRALRLEGATEFAPEQPATVTIVVPSDLSPQDYGLALVADLLADDKKTVLASVATPILRRTPRDPVTLTLNAAPEKLRAVAGGGGQADQISGSVWRAPGFAEPIAVVLTGLPEGVASPEVRLDPSATTFELPLRLPYGSAPGATKVRVTALASLGGERPPFKAATESAELNLEITPGEKPPTEPARVVFEDDEAFVGQLSKGGGTIQLDREQPYSGSAALKVTPDQRYNEMLEGLGLKIREHPGPGEYRYLRFAWKKQGGATICLQLNHDGNWGPGGSGKPEAKFRYHAGGDKECFGASVVVDAALPQEYTVVTRDLFADFGEFTLTGLALSPIDGEYGLFDHLYLSRDPSEFSSPIEPAPRP